MSTSRKDRTDLFWDLLIAIRLYLIVLFLILPSILLSVYLFYIQPGSIIILGLSALIIVRFILFEPRKMRKKSLKFSLLMLVPLTCMIFLNFLLGFLNQLILINLAGIVLPLSICIISILYFTIVILKKPFKGLNTRLIAWLEQWSSRGARTRIKKHIIPFISLCWLLITTFMLFIPYPFYSQKSPTTIEGQRVGIWVGSGTDLPNETMQMIADADIYFVTSGRISSLGPNMTAWLNRCKNYDIEVHFSVSTNYTGYYTFVNLWTIEDIITDSFYILDWFNASGFLGNPITTIVYDMEAVLNLAGGEYFYNREILDKLSEYRVLEQKFKDHNRYIEDHYNLSIQIVGEFVQGFDMPDGDDDITSYYGLLNDDQVTMSYMIYRKDFFEINYVLDSLRLFDEGDTIIINSWKFAGTKCWQDIDCVIEEGRLVLGYPGKKYNLELWRIDNFLDSYGIEGLHEFVEAVTSDPSTWADINIWHRSPYSELFDIYSFFFSILDLYTPLVKALFNTY